MPRSSLYVASLGLLLLFEWTGCSAERTWFEAEDFKAWSFGGRGSAGQVRIEEQSNASGGRAVHVGPDGTRLSDGVGDALTFAIDLPGRLDGTRGTVEVRYSHAWDDVAGNAIALYLDGARKGSISTPGTRTWNDFTDACYGIDLGQLAGGEHTVELRVIRGGTDGTLLDGFRVTGSRPADLSDAAAAYAFVKSLVEPATGLVRSTECKKWTTLSENALAAMAFIHQGDLPLAEGIFDFFDAWYNPATTFRGIPRSWDVLTRTPDRPENPGSYRVGENAFLLIALGYYRQATGSLGEHAALAQGLVTWLARTANVQDESLNEDDLSAALAALKPFEADLPADTPDVLLKLHSAFLNAVDYHTGDQLQLAALVFGDVRVLSYAGGLDRANTWQHDNVTVVRALAASSGEWEVNAEISAQILLAWTIWRADAAVDLSYLKSELERLWLRGTRDPSARGLPHQPNDWGDLNPNWYDHPMLDPTIYLLFSYWEFNPMAPGAKSLDLPYDFQECEIHFRETGSGVPERHPDAIGGGTLQVGSAANEVTYTIQLHRAYAAAKMQIRYSDLVAGDVIGVYFDDTYRGTLTTVATGSWNDFTWAPDVALGVLEAGLHTVKLVSPGGTDGVNLDVIRVAE